MKNLILISLLAVALAANGKEIVGGERSTNDVEDVIALVNKQTDEKMLKRYSEPQMISMQESYNTDRNIEDAIKFAMEYGEKRVINQCDSLIRIVESGITDADREIYRQQRLLATEYSSIDKNVKIQCISREEAKAKGISAEAYDSFKKKIELWNKMSEKPQSGKPDGELSFAFYRIRFPDNLREPEKDVIIRTKF